MAYSTFVSFAEEDRSFVDLLVELLRFHNIKVWCSNSSLKTGDRWRESIQEALSNVDSLIVVLSKDSCKSEWVKREVAIYLAIRKNTQVFPVSLDECHTSSIDPDLTHFQITDFRASMLTGFRELFTALNSEFLPDNCIIINDRRSKVDRRSGKDRRVGEISMRLRIGFWKAFQEHTGASKFEPILTLGGFLPLAFRAIKPEADKYVFQTKTGEQIPSSIVLDKAAENVFERYWSGLAGSHVTLKMIYVIEALAEHICANYKVTMIDRRTGERRSRAQS